MPAATLYDFAVANDAAAATTRKLQKQAVLSQYFRTLDEQDLRRAVRFAAGRAFAATDERVLNVGGAIVGEVVRSLLKLDPAALHELYIRHGELGNALREAWPEPTISDTGWTPLLLSDLAAAFDDLAATGNWENKSEILTGLLIGSGLLVLGVWGSSYLIRGSSPASAGATAIYSALSFQAALSRPRLLVSAETGRGSGTTPPAARADPPGRASRRRTWAA